MRHLEFVVLAAALALTAVAPARAAVFVVNSTLDAVDVAPGNGICDADPGAPTVCTLRAAVQEANALAGDDVIQLGAATYLLTIAGLEDDGLAGDIDVFSNVRIEGSGRDATVIEQTTGDRVFHVTFLGGALELTDLTVTGGDTASNPSNLGGGILNVSMLTLERVEVTGNRASIGGGVFNFRAMSGREVAIAGNTATFKAGGVASASFSASGGPGTTLILTDSTIGPNASTGGPTELELANAENVALTNVTVSPIWTDSESVLIGNQNAQLVHVTLLGGLGLFSFDADDDVTFANSAIGFCLPSGAQTPLLFRLGVNASTDASCGFAGAGGIEGPFGLGPLADNGGFAPSHLPLAGSALVDAAGGAFCVAEDQRGVARPQGSLCDIGAIEVPEPSLAIAGAAALLVLIAVRRRSGA
jgi:CSLREA domain-containing protein